MMKNKVVSLPSITEDFKLINIFTYCYLVFVFAMLFFEKDIARDASRSLAFILLLLPFVYLKLPRYVALYAAVGILYSTAVTFGNINSVYVDDWSDGIESVYIWVIIIPCYYLCVKSNISLLGFFLLLCIGILTSFYTALHDLITEKYRYQGHHGQAIPWGNISVLTAVFLLNFTLYFRRKLFNNPTERHFLILAIVAFIGFIVGVFCSLVSGTRGGWILLITAVPFLAYKLADTYRYKKYLLVAVILLISLLMSVFGKPVYKRIDKAVFEVKAYVVNDSDYPADISSVGSRFEFWLSAFKAIKAYPIQGIGRGGFHNWINQDPDFKGELRHKHPHNFFIALLMYGLVAICCFALLIYVFARSILYEHDASEDATLIRSLALLLLIGFCEFSLTETFWSTKIGSAYFIIVSVILMTLQLKLKEANTSFITRCE